MKSSDMNLTKWSWAGPMEQLTQSHQTLNLPLHFFPEYD